MIKILIENARKDGIVRKLYVNFHLKDGI